MSSVWDLANSQLRDLAVYEPGKPIEETARELGAEADQILKLASNENPLGPSPKAIEAMRTTIGGTHLYPDGGGYYLREALACSLGLSREHLILGAGSNEVIEFLGHAFLDRGDEIVTSEHAFVVYKLIAAVFGARTIEVPSRDFGHDLEAMADAVTAKTRLVFIANPNNPTGTLAPQDKIDRFVERISPEAVVVIDEAYFEYLDHPPDSLRFIRNGRNVVALRTFSKIHGLANLRIGYGIARPELIQVLHKVRQPFNVSGIAQAAALAALQDQEHQNETKRITHAGRAYLEAELGAMNLPFVPSAGNFVLVRVGNGADVFRALLERRIIVRALKGYKLPEWVRISVGTKEQNERCIAALKEILPIRAR
ncbi:MAG TPA: histidinol-phosphate transaminase [Chthoniobacterales bacterium]|nr:histidinol-phosphate transaminase [Chthoniobacterales bacterium]